MEQPFSHRERRSARRTGADQEREELGVGERRRAVADEPLARPDRFGPVADRHLLISYRLRLDGHCRGSYSSAMVRRPLVRPLVLLIAFVALTVLVGTGATDAVDDAVLALL